MGIGSELVELAMLHESSWLDLMYDESRMRASSGKWKQKNGKIILISEMELSHIENCMKMLTKNGDMELIKIWKPVFEQEIERRKQWEGMYIQSFIM